MAPPRPIPFIYRLFLLYLEPIFAINGARLSVFEPLAYLKIITPQTYNLTQPNSLEVLLLTQVASLYALFAFNEAVILRYVGQERRDIWRLLVIGMLLGDVGHLWALWKMATSVEGGAEMFCDPRLWTRWEEWGNLGLTWFGLVLRMCFVLGLGM